MVNHAGHTRHAAQPPTEPLQPGYARIDEQPGAADALVVGMELTARWPAVRRLRIWEREQFGLRPGDRLLDVGCGVGDVALDLAADVGPTGEVVALDASETMLAAARRRAAAAGPAAAVVHFRVGDALAPDVPPSSFQAVRAERVVQWLDRPGDAVAAMVAALAPGGRLSLIDTDWRTFVVDVEPRDDVEAVTRAMVGLRGDGAVAGSRLLNLCRDAGLVDLRCTGAVHVWTDWDPAAGAGPAGLFPIHEFTAHLVEAGALDAGVRDRAVSAMEAAGRAGRFAASVSLLGVCGRRP